MILAVVIAFTTALLVAGALNVNTDNQNVSSKKIKSNNSTPRSFTRSIYWTIYYSEVFSENGDSTTSSNKVALSFNLNDGNNVLGQQ